MRRCVAIFILLIVAAVAVHAQQRDGNTHKQQSKTATANADTVKRKTLQEVRVTANALQAEAVTTTTTQVLTVEHMERSGSLQLSDAAREFTGVVIKDYGGIGGIKTISARGLGSQFSTLVIDGVAVNDAQNGQVDLGRYLIGDIQQLTFANAQTESLLQSARSYAAGNIMSLESMTPEVDSLRPTRIRAAMTAGSFGLIAPSLQWQQRLGRKVSMQLYANHLQCRGDYPFTLYYTNSRQDSSSREVRRNSQMWQTTASGLLRYQPAENRILTAKVHYMQSYHALPGPVILYNAKASEHSEEQLFFAQARYRIYKGRHSLQLLGKVQRSFDLYEDTAAHSSVNKLLHNEYNQREGYLSGCYRYMIGERLSMAMSSDVSAAGLTSNLAKNNDVTRGTLLNAAALNYDARRLTMSAHLLTTNVSDRQKQSDTAARYPMKVTPYIGGNLTLLAAHGSTLRLRAFYKETYRIPTFNELYYYTVSHNLRPERAHQGNIGLTYTFQPADPEETLLQEVLVVVDGYRNMVTDKIIAIPTQNMYLWSMANLGRAEITGLDSRIDARLLHTWIECFAGITYSYQHVVDVTTPHGKTYGHQIPYTPRHSGGATLRAHCPWIDLAYSVMCVGTRYSLQQNTDASRLPAYTDHSVTLTKNIILGKSKMEERNSLTVQFKIQNLFDKQYEIVRNYPMMGRNYRLSISINI